MCTVSHRFPWPGFEAVDRYLTKQLVTSRTALIFLNPSHTHEYVAQDIFNSFREYSALSCPSPLQLPHRRTHHYQAYANGASEVYISLEEGKKASNLREENRIKMFNETIAQNKWRPVRKQKGNYYSTIPPSSSIVGPKFC
jgi:hypothetical protein